MTPRQAGAPPVDAPLGNVLTDRLDLRRFVASDLDDLAAVFAHPEVWQFPYGRAFTRVEAQAFLDAQIREWEDNEFGCWAARERVSGDLVGYVGVSVPRFLPEILPAVEVGWRFQPSAWGKGYAAEGARVALDESFGTLGLDVVCSVPQTDNPASVRVAERLGMRLVRPIAIPANERRGALDALLFEVTREEWSASLVARG